jgi:predicted O-methyltransferase YrrM
MPEKYKEIYGYFDFEDIYRGIANKFPSGHYLEIGTWLGKSTCFMGEIIKENNLSAIFYCLDNYLGEENATDQQEIVEKEGGNIYFRFLKNMIERKVLDYMTPINMQSARASELFPDNYFDFIFLDAAHLYEDVRLDLKSWYPKLKIGGIFAGHDYYMGTEVKRAVDEFFDCKINVVGNCFLVKKA